MTPAQVTANRQIHLHAAGTEGKRYTLNSLRGGGEPPSGRYGHERSHGVRWMEFFGRGQQIRMGSGVSDGVVGN